MVKETPEKTYNHVYTATGRGSPKEAVQEKRPRAGRTPVVICFQLPDNGNTNVTNMAEYLAAKLIEEYSLSTPLVWIEHYPEHEGEPGEYSLARFLSWGQKRFD